MDSQQALHKLREELKASQRQLHAAVEEARSVALRSENLLAALFGNSPMPIALSRREDGRVVDVNDEWSRLTGFAREQAVGRTAVEMGLWPDAQDRTDALRNLELLGRVRNHEVRFVTHAGEPRVLLLDMMPIEIGSETYMVIYHTDVTSQREAQVALRAGEEALQQANRKLGQQLGLFRSMESLAKVGYWVSDPGARGLVWSNGLYDLAGLEPGSVNDAAAGRGRIVEEDRPRFEEARRKVDGSIVEYRWLHPDGTIRWLRSRMRRQVTAAGATVDFGVVQDVTTERETTLALQQKLDLIQAITTRTPGLLFQMRRRRDGSIEFPFVSHAAKEIYDINAEEFMADPQLVHRLHHPDDVDEIVATLSHSARSLSAWRHEYRIKLLDGRVRWLHGEAVPERESDGSVLWNGFTADITDQKAAEQEIQRLAFYDILTGLPNRRLLTDRLHHTLATCEREHASGALLFIDLDNFKDLNDTLGHDVGDLLLKQVAARIVECVRAADTVSRFGGDEFVVMLDKLGPSLVDAASKAEAVARKILVKLNRVYQIGGREHHSTPSIGVALFEDRSTNVDELLKRADLAMYQAKAAGRNALRFFDPDMQAVAAARAALESDLRQGLQRDEFRLYYQPVVDETGAVVGAEALARWLHPVRGPVPPSDFIALAEQTGLILPLGQWVLNTACAQLVAWAAQSATSHLSLSVNVSARQFRQPEFADQINAVLRSTGADPSRLKLELTESLLVTDVDDAIRKMSELRAVGVGFSLDDFGTGYSSLAYLKRLPLEQLKIDQSFVRDVLDDPNDAIIARTILTLGQSLGLTVVAEGVETVGQRDFLRRHGCKVFQGYLFGRPVPVQDFSLDPPGSGSVPLQFEI